MICAVVAGALSRAVSGRANGGIATRRNRGKRYALTVCGPVMAALAALGGVGCAPSSDAGPALRLTEVNSVPLPVHFEPAGGAFNATGTQAVLWSFGQTSVIVVGDGAAREVAMPIQQPPVAAAFTDVDSILELVHGSRPQILRVSLTGRILSETPLGGGVNDTIRVTTAARTREGWVWGGVDPRGNFRLHRPAETRPALTMSRNEWARYLPDTLSELTIHVASAPSGGWTATSLWPPYEQWVDSGTGVIIGPGAGAPERAPPPGEAATMLDAPLFVSLPTLSLDEGYLQVLADIRSDAREMRVLSRSLHLRRSKELNAPLGFLASHPGQRRLLATRRTNGVAVVVYRWDWGSDSLTRSGL